VQLDIDRLTKWIRALRHCWLSDAELAAIEVPTLILAPRLDQWHAGPTVAMAESLARRMPSATLQILENAGSLIALEDPERIARIFIESRDRSGGPASAPTPPSTGR
jgi:pimeloyl-ACP methyl ester carboxylesterase